jgi:transcriptional regulator with XRE-family HTH domain
MFLILDIYSKMTIMRNTMPAQSPRLTALAAERLQALGGQIRAQRKALGISATAAAEAAGLSRVTLHRIEKGEPAVTVGAWLNAMEALGLQLGLHRPADASPQAGFDRKGWVPARIALADYPQLRALAWQVHGTDTLTPAEALGIYERNARHLDAQALQPAERELIDALHTALASPPPAAGGEGV